MAAEQSKDIGSSSGRLPLANPPYEEGVEFELKMRWRSNGSGGCISWFYSEDGIPGHDRREGRVDASKQKMFSPLHSPITAFHFPRISITQGIIPHLRGIILVSDPATSRTTTPFIPTSCNPVFAPV